MRIFVINLEARRDRRRTVESHLGKAGVAFEFFSAITGAQALGAYLSGVNNWITLLETGRFATPGELGCCASHRELWNTCIAMNEPIVIMEDDFEMTDDFAATLGHADRLINHCGFMRLEPIEQRWSRKKGLEPVVLKEADGWQLLYQRMPSVRLTCYAIAPACARALLKASDVFAGPVDHMVRRCWLHGQPIMALEPAAVRLSGHAEQSSILGRRKMLLRHALRPLQLVYRWLERERARRFAARVLEDIRRDLAALAPVE